MFYLLQHWTPTQCEKVPSKLNMSCQIVFHANSSLRLLPNINSKHIMYLTHQCMHFKLHSKARDSWCLRKLVSFSSKMKMQQIVYSLKITTFRACDNGNGIRDPKLVQGIPIRMNWLSTLLGTCFYQSLIRPRWMTLHRRHEPQVKFEFRNQFFEGRCDWESCVRTIKCNSF